MRANPIEILAPTYVDKTWGQEVHIHNSDNYCGKLLLFKADKYASFHYHLLKTETWYVLEGSFLLEFKDLKTGNGNSLNCKQGDIIHIPAGNPHKIWANTDVKIMEVSTRDYPEDTYRLSPSSP